MMRRIFELWPQRLVVRVVFYGCLIVPVFFFGWTLYAVVAYNLAENADYLKDMKELNRGVLSFSLCAAALVYGANRLFVFHPVFNWHYFRWLTATPYTGRQELPLGPVHLVALDLPFAGAVFLVSVVSGAVPWQVPPMCLLIGYTTALAFAALRTGDVFLWIVLCSMWPVALLSLPSSAGCAFLVPLLVLLGRWAVTRNLGAFPWHARESINPLPQKSASISFGSNYQKEESELGWPLVDLGPRAGWAHISGGLACMVSLWVTSVIVCGGMCFERLFGESLDVKRSDWIAVSIFYLLPATLAAAGRLLIYIPRARSPLTLSGRVAFRRIIIPSYDKVYVPSLFALVTGAVLPRLLFVFFNSAYWVIGITFGICMLILLGMGPNLKTWTLTGSYRLQRSSLGNETQIRVRQRQETPQ